MRELVRFDQKAAERLRVWDYVDGDLAERKLSPAAPAACQVLGAWWVLVPHERWGPMLRLSHDPEGTQLVETETEAACRAEAVARQTEAAARLSAEARVQQLEAELQRLRSSKP